MIESTKIDFRCRRIGELDDLTDLVAIFFPGNRNQQHAAARILLTLKSAIEPLAVVELEERYGIKRRTLQRTRAKLARLGLIERVSWMSSRYGGRTGWRVSSRMSRGLRQLANRIERWRGDNRDERRRKDEQLVELLQ